MLVDAPTDVLLELVVKDVTSGLLNSSCVAETPASSSATGCRGLQQAAWASDLLPSASLERQIRGATLSHRQTLDEVE